MTLRDTELNTLREQEGVVRESLLNSRVIVFSCSAYRSMCDELYDQFQSGASVILYRMGKGYAKKLAAAIPKFGPSEKSTVEGFERLARHSGWGDINCKISNEKTVDCIVHRSPFVLRRKDIGRTSCYFFAGVLASIASSIYGKRFEAQETECETAGSTFCKFKLKEVYSETGK